MERVVQIFGRFIQLGQWFWEGGWMGVRWGKLVSREVGSQGWMFSLFWFMSNTFIVRRNLGCRQSRFCRRFFRLYKRFFRVIKLEKVRLQGMLGNFVQERVSMLKISKVLIVYLDCRFFGGQSRVGWSIRVSF